MAGVEAVAKRILADKYEVVGTLGEGATGIVYDAVRTTDGVPVALKVMHDTLAGDRQIRGRFLREAAILRRLDGPHLCPIFEFGEVPRPEGASLLYIALRKIEGESLAEVIARGLLPVPRVLDVMLQVLAALTSAHAQGIIHRDLKPSNVLLEGGTNVVVVDFGMSKIVTGGGTGTTNLTTHNMVFGTPEYMSPEQARGDELDARCDVYAAGIMFYELLVGKPPFFGGSALKILTEHLTSTLEPPSARPGGHDRSTPALDAIVLEALARDRDARFASAADFAAAIERLDTNPTPVTLPFVPTADAFAATVRESGAPVPTRPPTDVDVTAPTLISARPPGMHPTPRGNPMPRPPSVRPPSEPSTGTWVLVWILVSLASIATGAYFALRG
jgi:serine/threonine-protein kinase